MLKDLKIAHYTIFLNFDKKTFDYKRIAEDLLQAELKSDKTRNSTIREGLCL